MKKLAYGDGQVYVSLSAQEFAGLAGQPYSDFPDGSSISLAPIKAKLDLINAKEAELVELKTVAQSVVNKLKKAGI